MATKKASALKAFMTGIVCVVMIGLGWLPDPPHSKRPDRRSRLFAWFSLAAAAIALIVAVYFTFRALTIREPEKESDLESEGEGSDQHPFSNN
jgi:small-conductance mechanosensitive channel